MLPESFTIQTKIIELDKLILCFLRLCAQSAEAHSIWLVPFYAETKTFPRLEVLGPNLAWARRTWFADRGFQTKQNKNQVWTRPKRPHKPCASSNRHRASSNWPKARFWARSNGLWSRRWVSPNRPKAGPSAGPNRPRARHWFRLNRFWSRPWATRVEVSPLKIAKRCKIAVKLSKSVRFALNAMNAVIENFSPLIAECSEKKFNAKIANLKSL